MDKYKTIHENAVNINPYSIEQQVKEQIQYLKRQLLKLDKYTFDEFFEEISKDEDGEYIKLQDVLNLFSTKIVKRKLIKLEY